MITKYNCTEVSGHDALVIPSAQLTMADHINMLCQSCLFQLCQLFIVRSSLTLETAKMLVHAFISSRLDYCNSLLSGSVIVCWQNSRLFRISSMCPDRNKKSDNITPVLHQLHWLQLHWLPVHQRITFKLAMITFKCLHGLAPSYLADVCIPVSSVVGRWQLRLAETFVMPHTRTTISQRDFAVSGPATWNSLPIELRTSLSTQTFAKNSKIIYSSTSTSEDSCLTGPI